MIKTGTAHIRLEKITLFLFSIILCAQSSLFSQTSQTLHTALQHLEQKSSDWNLVDGDLDGLRLTDAYRSDHNGVQHLYFIQQYKGVDVFQAMGSVAMDEGNKVLYATQNFIPNLEEKVRPATSSISAGQAVQKAMEDRGYEPPVLTRSHRTDAGRVIEFEKTSAFAVAPRAQKVYFQADDGTLRLHWDVSFFIRGDSDHWSVRVDAASGQVSHVDSWTEHCSFPHPEDVDCLEESNDRFHHNTHISRLTESRSASGTYNVFGVPIESPIFGSRTMIQGPVNEEASPYGWHDTDGEEGAEYTILRGNNVDAIVDRNGDFFRDTFYNADGGPDLIFDFPFDPDAEPRDNAAADATNLFYMNNYMHDFSWAYGFNEAAGNFQAANYSGEGLGSDHVVALTQFDAQSGDNLNNASFSTPSDGNGNGTMRMLVWDRGAGGAEYLEITGPPEVAGFYEAQPANFGGPIVGDPIEGDLIFVDDGTAPPTDACQDIDNGDELQGKIALIDRGQCEFGSKILRAEENGAIAAIVINNQPTGLVTMGAGQDGDEVSIPAIFITLADGNIIRDFAGNGLAASIAMPNPDGVMRLSSGFDNGIIAHEYAHGISNRLTGGPSEAGCLGNDEQMGEGWSDFFTLVTSVKQDDTGELPRGVGNYVIRKDTDGRGIRSYPYSTDMDINPVTYYSIFDASIPHGLGQVWASMIWDLYWALVDRYGFDPDLINGTGGNNIAVQLVMDGMKLQTCQPGFVDGRDAILAADRINNDGANQCLIWDVFARRGLGYGADQGDVTIVQDAEESYDVKPSCIQELKISKSVTPVIEPGDIFDVRLEVTNHKTSAVTEVIASDLIPDGCTYVNGSANISPDINGDILNFELGSMDTMDQIVITYEVQSSEDLDSDELYFDDFEESVFSRWYVNSITGSSNFMLSETDPYSGSQSWFVPNTENANDVYFSNVFPISVSGEQPILRFFHKYETEPGFDGGIVEYSFDTEVWHDLGDDMFRNEYRGRIAYTTFALVNQNAFWGSVDDWVATYIDLSDFIGQDLYVRFRFGEVEGGSATGWNIDDLGMYDMHNYQTEACVTSNEGDSNCDLADGKGTFVEYREGTNTEDPEKESKWTVFPNPTEQDIRISFNGSTIRDATIRLRDIRGNVLYRKEYSSMRPGAQYLIPMFDLSSGMYFVEWETSDQWYSKKIIKH